MPFVKSPVLTPRKLAANRRNALKSTGPRTYRGRCRVAMNALRHGCAASPKMFRSLLVRNHEDAKLYDWIYYQVCDALSPTDRHMWMTAARTAQQVWCLVREGRRSGVRMARRVGVQGRAGVQGPQGPEGPRAPQRSREFQGYIQPPARVSLWSHFRIPTRLNGGFRTNPRYAVKSIDSCVTSRIQFCLDGPYDGFKTNLRLKFWVRGRRNDLGLRRQAHSGGVSSHSPGSEALGEGSREPGAYAANGRMSLERFPSADRTAPV